MFVISIFGDGMGSATAIRNAADALSPGDLLMIELHRPGPRAGLFGQFGYIPVEWWPDDFDAVSYAVRRGVVVVAAAGNGSQNLDDPVYDTPLTGFPPGWRNPFKRRERDSGAILVGAGAPPEGVNGSAWGPVRSRLDFSNYGSAVDAHGPGREVTTCGYGDLQSGSEDRWYTQQFSGTSSALPTVVGALACVQGMLTASGVPRLTPELARRALHATGTPQQAGPGAPHTQRIGAQPDVPAIVKWARARSGDGGTDPGKQNGKEDSKESEAGPRKFPKLEKNEFKDMLEASRPPSAASIGSLEQRVEELENTVGILMHFIPESQRPNLGVPEEP